MSDRAAIPAWIALSTVVAIGVFGLVVIVLESAGDTSEESLLIAGSVAYATAGLLIIRRSSNNRLGWILMLGGLAMGLSRFGELYPRFAAAHELPGAVPVVLFGSAMFLPTYVVAFPVPAIVFPDGLLVSPRWRWIRWVLAFCLLWGLCTGLFQPGVLGPLEGTSLSGIENPLGLAAFDGATPINVLGLSAFLALFAGAVASVTIRFRQSSGLERLQLKWFSYGAVVGAVSFVGFLVLGIIDNEFSTVPEWFKYPVYLPLLALIAIPLTIAVAVVRHGLYDIDRLISRTFGYGVVLTLLAAAYTTTVFLVRIFVPGDSAVAVAISTLGVAALFNPIRIRVHAFIDRRFFRSRYDTSEVVEQLASEIKDEVDAARLSARLVRIVEATLSPATSSLWVREDVAGGRRGSHRGVRRPSGQDGFR